MIDEVYHLENELKKVGLLEEEDDMYNPPFPTNMKKLSMSKKSSFSNYEIEEAQEHMFGNFVLKLRRRQFNSSEDPDDWSGGEKVMVG
jgi:hypothetical protein